MTQSNFEDDVAVYQSFLREWEAGTLTGAHPVIIMVDYWAKVVAIKHGCASQYMDIKSETLLSLARESQYAGRCSLRGYVMRILIRKVPVVKAPLVRLPRQSKKGEKPGVEERIVYTYVMLDDEPEEAPVRELPDERSDKLADKVLLRLAYDKLMQEKIAVMPELTRTIIDIVTEHEECLGSRRIAEVATGRLGRKVTRHQVEIALMQLSVIVGAALWLM